MRIYTTKQRRQIDAYTIENENIDSNSLMERAAIECSKWLIARFNFSKEFKIFCGSGNNGGDGLAMARQLSALDRKVIIYIIQGTSQFSVDSTQNLNLLKKQNIVSIQYIDSEDDFPIIKPSDVIVDCLFGSGLSRSLEGSCSQLIQYLNTKPSARISIDIPSGLFGEKNVISETSVIFKADATLTFQFPFLSFFLADNAPYVGNWFVLPIGLHTKIIEESSSPFYYIERSDIHVKKRLKYSHKGTYGHALLIAGSEGMMGAAVLSAQSCLRTGVGLITAHIPKNGTSVLQIAVPECIVSMDCSESSFSKIENTDKYSAAAIGPGLGKHATTVDALEQFLKICKIPLVLDADALNIISEKKTWLPLLPENSILTPHPKEFDRLTEDSSNSFDRLQKQIEFSKIYKVYIVLKGAHTSISCPDGHCFFNSTGNPGMATGGSGDVLTGIILSLLAQGYTPKESAITGVYIHGLAGDLAAQDLSEESMIAGDIVNYISKAFIKLHNNYNAKN